jgi:EmrB/QacA subfamily drug resistance transporter
MSAQQATLAELVKETRRAVPDWAILALVCTAQFMVVLDVSVVNVALPSIRADLGLTAGGLQWVINAYTIAFGGFLLLGGRAADLFGQKRIFLVGLAVFTGASLAGGLAANGTMLLLARIAQGLGGAVLSPATLTILTLTFPEGPARAKALGVWSALAGAGGAAGALLGGVLTDVVGWRWIFFINLPVGLVAIAAIPVVLGRVREQRAARSLDVLGGVLATGGLLVLVYGIVRTETASWGSASTVAVLGTAVVLLGWFVAHEAKVATAPLVPLGIFRLRSVAAANGVMLLVGSAVFSSWYFLSLYMQNVLNFSPLQAGLAFVPQTLAIVAGAQVSSRIVGRIGARTLLLIGPTISAIGLLWLSWGLSPSGSYLRTLLVPGVLVTFGVGLSFTPIALSATGGVPREQAGLASGLVTTMRQVGGALGLAVLATIAVDHTSSLLGAEGLPRGAAQASGPGSAAVLAALTSGYARAFLVGGALALLASLAALALPRRIARGTAAANQSPAPVAPEPRPQPVGEPEPA